MNVTPPCPRQLQQADICALRLCFSNVRRRAATHEDSGEDTQSRTQHMRSPAPKPTAPPKTAMPHATATSITRAHAITSRNAGSSRMGVNFGLDKIGMLICESSACVRYVVALFHIIVSIIIIIIYFNNKTKMFVVNTTTKNKLTNIKCLLCACY